MKMSGTLILALFALIFATNVALAADYEADFYLNTKDVELCPSGTVEVIGYLKNMGSNEDVYTISSKNAWVTLAPDKVKLMPNEESKIYFYITPAFNAEAGIYSIEMVVESKNVKKTDTLTVSVIKCHAVDVKATNTQLTSCVGDLVEVGVDITNLGKNDEEFKICSSKTACITETVLIKTGDTQHIVFITPVTRDYEKVEVKAESATSYAKDSAFVEIIADKNCDGVAILNMPPEASVCKGDAATFDVTVKNTGLKDGVFTITKNYGVLEQTTVTLASKEYMETTLTINSGDLDVGTYVIEVKATSDEAGDVAVSKLYVEDCYSAIISVEPTIVETCAGGSSTYAITIKNDGKVDDTFELTSTAGTLADTSLQVKAGETKTTTLTITSNIDETASKYARVQVKSPHLVKELNMRFDLIAKEECYSFYVYVSKDRIIANEMKGYLFTITIGNDGKLPLSIATNVEGPDWIFINPKEVTLGINEETEVYVYVSPQYDTKSGIYTITVTLDDTYSQKTQELEFIYNKEKECNTLSCIPEDKKWDFSLPSMENDTLLAILLGLFILIAIVYGPELFTKERREKVKRRFNAGLNKIKSARPKALIVKKPSLKRVRLKKIKPGVVRTVKAKKVIKKVKKLAKKIKRKTAKRKLVKIRTAREKEIREILDNI